MQQILSTRYTLQAPDDWLDQSTVTLLGPPRPGFFPNVTINQEPPPEGMQLDGYFAQQRRELMTLEGFRLEAHGDRLLGGTKALWHRYSWITPQRFGITQLQLMGYHGGIAYTLTASATSEDFPSFEPAFEQLIAGFRFTA